MVANVGATDRIVRIVLGVVLLSGYFWLSSGARWLALVGLVLIVTASISFCPLYKVLGINTGAPAAKSR